MTLVNGPPEPSVESADLVGRARDFISASQAENTMRSYATGWRQFEAWCSCHRFRALPATTDTVALYVAALADDAMRPATIDVRLAAIAAAHRAAGHPTPTKAEAVRLVRRGVRRTMGTAQRQVRPVTVEDLRAMVAGLHDDVRGVRDRALLLMGFAGALRRSELVGLDVGDVVESSEGLTVRIRRSKTDQEGEGRSIGVPYGSNPATCPVRAWKRWLDVSGIVDGAAFRPIDRRGTVATRLSDRAVAEIVKRHAASIGLDPCEVSGHSLRSGLCTTAAAAGVAERIIAKTTGHKGTAMLRRYIREGSLFVENAAAAAGL